MPFGLGTPWRHGVRALVEMTPSTPPAESVDDVELDLQARDVQLQEALLAWELKRTRNESMHVLISVILLSWGAWKRMVCVDVRLSNITELMQHGTHENKPQLSNITEFKHPWQHNTTTWEHWPIACSQNVVKITKAITHKYILVEQHHKNVLPLAKAKTKWQNKVKFRSNHAWVHRERRYDAVANVCQP